jgi:hypothetical protein
MVPTEIFHALRFDSGPPLFYLLARPFLHLAELWSLSDTVVRVLPFLAIAVLAFGIRSLPNDASRPAFLALLAGFALLGFYSAEARAYAVLAALDFALFLQLRQRREDAVHLVLVALLTASALMTHYLALFFVVAAAVVLVVERRWKKLAAVVLGAALFLPWLPTLLRQPAQATAWLHESAIDSVAGFLSSLGGVGRIPPAFGASIPAAFPWTAGLAGAILAFGLARASRTDPEIRSGLLLVALTLAGVLAAEIVRPVAFAGRTEMAVLPVWIWLAARGAAHDRVVRAAATAAGALGLFAFAVAAPGMTGRPAASPVRAAEMLETSAEPADVVIAGTTFYLPLRLAHDRGTLRARLTAFPASLESHPGWFLAEAPAPDAYRGVAAELARVPAGGRVWLALHPLFLTPEMGRILESKGAVRLAAKAPDAVILLWTAPPRS